MRDRAPVEGRGSSDGAGDEAEELPVPRRVTAGRGSAEGVLGAATAASVGTGLRLTSMGESCERGFGADAASGDAERVGAGAGEAALGCAVGEELRRMEDLRPANVGSVLSGGDV